MAQSALKALTDMRAIRCIASLCIVMMVVGALLFCQQAAALCLSGHPSPRSEFSSSKYVLLGKVVAEKNISSPDDPTGISGTIYYIEVTLVFKGSVGTTVKIWSENTSSRFPMHIGSKYLLFLTETRTGEVFVDSCGNSSRVE